MKKRSDTKTCRHNQQHCLANTSCDLSSTWLAPWYAFSVSIYQCDSRIIFRSSNYPYWKPYSGISLLFSLHCLLIEKKNAYDCGQILHIKHRRWYRRQIQITREIPIENRRADRMKEKNEKEKNKTNDPNLTLYRRNLFVRLFIPLHHSCRHFSTKERATTGKTN